MELEEQVEESNRRCPHCGRKIHPDPRYTFTFHKWGTIAFVTLISVMMMMLDFVDDGAYEFELLFWSRLDWSIWAVLGLWTLYIPAQLLRSAPEYGWLVIPIFGAIFSLLFAFLDQSTGDNEGFLGFDWALYVIIPFATVFVGFPLVARIARVEPSYIDQLNYLVEHYDEEQK